MGAWVRFRRLLGGVSWDAAAVVGVGVGCGAVLLEASRRTSTRDADVAEECRYAPTAARLNAGHVRWLERDGVVIIPAFLSPALIAAARRDAAKVRADRAHTTQDDGYRDDVVCWVREADGTHSHESDIDKLGDGLLHCVKTLRGVACELERQAYDESFVGGYRVPQQCQLSCYMGTSLGYKRHRDRCVSTFQELGLLEWLRLSDYRDRAVTAILYLNEPDWRCDADGGALRCFLEAAPTPDGGPATPEVSLDVSPAGGTLVLFHAGRIDHCVQPARRDRYALTLWIATPGGPQKARL